MTTSTPTGRHLSHLQAAELGFTALAEAPSPLTVDCDALTGPAATDIGLPAGTLSVAALRQWLLANPDRHAARDAIWRDLVVRARLAGGHWRLAAAGMAMPALRAVANRLCHGFRVEPYDIDAEVLTGFLSALDDRVDVARPAVYASLVMAAFRAGRALRLAESEAVPVEDVEALAAVSQIPRRPYGHPDLLVERATALGLINPADEQPWIDVRLGHRAIEPIAARLGVTCDFLRMRLTRVDDRLANALATGLLTGTANTDAADRINASTTGIRAAKATTVTSVVRALPVASIRRATARTEALAAA